MSKFLFSVIPTNDFGCLTRSLPIARELKLRGHQVAFCHAAKGPQMLIAEEGFQNLLPGDPLYYLFSDPTIPGFFRLLGKGRILRTLKAMNSFLRKAAKQTTSDGNVDDFNFEDFFFFENEEFTRANIAAFMAMINSYQADAIVDFFNPWACVAARILKKPVIAVIQSQMHPQSPGLIWWKDHPPIPPISVPVLDKILCEHELPAIKNMIEDLMLGALILVVGMPELDPIAETAGVTYLGAVLW